MTLLADNLDTPPTLDALAAAAAISPFHFHRVWRQLTRETVGDTIARLRIAASQHRLQGGDARITDVAMAGGFGSSQSFARTFRRVTDLSPTDYLSSGQGPVKVESNPAAEVRIDLRPEGHLVALRREGGAYRELNALFWQVWNWVEESGHMGGLGGIYGIPLDDPLSVPEERLRYDACLHLSHPVQPPRPLRTLVLPAGEYAVLRHNGSYESLEDSNQAMVAWMIGSGREPADFPLFHHFLDDPEEVPPDELRTDVMIRLQQAENLS